MGKERKKLIKKKKIVATCYNDLVLVTSYYCKLLKAFGFDTTYKGHFLVFEVLK